MKKNKVLLKGGRVLTMDKHLGNFKKADILITGDTIASVGIALDAEEAEVIDASQMIVMPGLIDTHRHLWESSLKGIAADWSLLQYLQHVLGPLAASFRPEDVYTANLLGALEALNAGITTVFDWSHIMNTPDHADEAIRGLREAGIRAKFGYGTPGLSVWEWFYESQLTHPEDARRLRSSYFASDDQLVTMAMAIRGPEYATMDVSRNDIALARDLSLQMSMHIGSGSFGPKYNAIGKLHTAGLLGADMNFAHCNTLTDADFKLLAAYGCSVSITPEIEMQMGLGFPATGRALANGIRPSLGVDVVTGTGGDLFSQMKIALQTERALQNEKILQQGEMPQSINLTVWDALQFATQNGAEALNLGRKIGTLTPGKQADIIMIDASAINLAPVHDPAAAVVLYANPSNVDTVFVAGRAVKRNGHLLHHDLNALQQKAMSSRNYLLEKVEALEKASLA
ncbi:amidohydrolase family protein [Adhaeribacter radiodurans]|uniref:Amidohydrolase family protein n=1 Tax=Adhaeribacter radiodurans TaxID=2745197 RepID=A0A7L7L5P6_9BACT|nr:amidohydrolase family protein [Adhaeribacter radiodurans]QMU28142.1 amidohydrolase family protein [Adhaeribacter radiodurans]